MAKKNVTITLYMSEMIYDVQNKSYLKGRSMVDQDPARVAYMQANDDDENLNQVLRSIGGAFGSLKSELSEYIEESASTGNNILQPNEDIIVALKMPSNFNEAAVKVVSEGLHKYIVNMALAEWYKNTDPNDFDSYMKLAIENMKEVRDGINKRLRPVRQEPNA
jgi:hypothetical protein